MEKMEKETSAIESDIIRAMILNLLTLAQLLKAHCITFRMYQNMVMGKFHTYDLLRTQAEFIVV